MTTMESITIKEYILEVAILMKKIEISVSKT